MLSRIPNNSRILDVGIGTATALVANASIIREKNLYVKGVDIDEDYVKTANALVKTAKMSDIVEVVHASIYDYDSKGGDKSKVVKEKYDCVYFSGSFMLLPDPVEAIKVVVGLLRDESRGKIFFTQTVEVVENRFLEWVKPRLSYWTTIDFGKVTYQEQLEEVIKEGGLTVESVSVIPDGKNNPGKRFSALVVAVPSMNT